MSPVVKQRILFAAGIAAAIAVELLAQGPWAHAVWAPVAIMLITDLGGVSDPKKQISVIPHRVRLILGASAATAVELLSEGKWAHAVWAPTMIMLLANFRKVVGLTPVAAIAAAPPASELDSSEAKTPLDRPR